MEWKGAIWNIRDGKRVKGREKRKGENRGEESSNEETSANKRHSKKDVELH